jgi:glycine dehydrogenase subunit 1
MSLMGPKGFQDIGETIIQRSRYAMKAISGLEGVKILFSDNAFKEFVVNFDGTGKTVESINRDLLGYEIFGGIDLSGDFPELGNSALYCVTEIHSKEDLDRLVASLKEVIAK